MLLYTSENIPHKIFIINVQYLDHETIYGYGMSLCPYAFTLLLSLKLYQHSSQRPITSSTSPSFLCTHTLIPMQSYPQSHTLISSCCVLCRFQQEMLNRYGLDLGNLYPPSTPPHPPPRPPRGEGEGETEEAPPPMYWIVPGVKKTSVELKFKRRQLEEFMDR